jgi:hypothetical protein
MLCVHLISGLSSGLSGGLSGGLFDRPFGDAFVCSSLIVLLTTL